MNEETPPVKVMEGLVHSPKAETCPLGDLPPVEGLIRMACEEGKDLLFHGLYEEVTQHI